MNNQISDQEHATEVSLWIVLTAIHQPGLLAKRKDLHLDRYEDSVELCKLGCDARVLQDVLVFAAEMPKFYPPISAPVLRQLARDIREVLRRMIRTTPSLPLLWVRDRENGGQELYTEPTGGTLHVSAKLEEALSLKADCYERLAQLCTQNMVPTRAQIQKLAYLWPVFYVEEKTGKRHYKKIAKLLSLVGIDKHEKQLMKGVADAKSNLPLVVQWMKWSLSYIEQLSGRRGGALQGR